VLYALRHIKKIKNITRNFRVEKEKQLHKKVPLDDNKVKVKLVAGAWRKKYFCADNEKEEGRQKNQIKIV
jgi:hypothetical protein